METKSHQAFSTPDAILAFSLYMAGVPFAEPRLPCINVYDIEILRKLGFTGMELEEAARSAMAKGKKGHVEYSFQMTSDVGHLLQAYKNEREQIEEQGNDCPASIRMKEIMEMASSGAMMPQEAVLRLSCVLLKLRVEFMSMWKGREDLTMLRVPLPGKTTTREVICRNSEGKLVPGTAVSSPGHKIISLSASEKTRKRLKL